MSKLGHSNCKTMEQIERDARAHLSNCTTRVDGRCNCGAVTMRTEAQARAKAAADYSEIIFFRAYKAGELKPMSEAPMDRMVLAALPDDQAPNQEKVRCVRVRFNNDAWLWIKDRSWIDLDSDGASIDEDELEGWVTP